MNLPHTHDGFNPKAKQIKINDEVFPTISAAAKKHGISPTSLADASRKLSKSMRSEMDVTFTFKETFTLKKIK
tara:strand:+ start:35204 stop:35422 length:219 start_codon:yes stop_codon:yes gene_type:complete